MPINLSVLSLRAQADTIRANFQLRKMPDYAIKAFADAATVDLPVCAVMNLCSTRDLIQTTIALPIPTCAAFLGYFIRHLCRQDENPTLYGGLLGGALNYWLKGQHVGIGALNNGAYELARSEIGKNLRNLLPLTGIIALIEGIDGMCSMPEDRAQGMRLGATVGALIALSIQFISLRYEQPLKEAIYALYAKIANKRKVS